MAAALAERSDFGLEPAAPGTGPRRVGCDKSLLRAEDGPTLYGEQGS